jgi:predicted nucleic acid-binding protein
MSHRRRSIAETTCIHLPLQYLEEDRSTFELGATLYRELRKRGIAIRNSIDCLIAGLVLQQGVYFLESDRDYSFIDQHYPLHRL